MASLDRSLRKELENAVKNARQVAEAGARQVVEQLAVQHHEPWPSMSAPDRRLRNRLRAHGRQLGDVRDEKKGSQAIERLVGECAYEHWHRLLFARFLAENDLLIEPGSGMPLSLDECKELARERGIDWLVLASEFAEKMLPQIFRAGDPVLEVTFPPEKRHGLEKILETLSRDVFTADDSLGWVYQYWQSERKDAVNESAKKIGADELPAVTQLFTEDYMVLFLLHNTLGAWWAAKRRAEGRDYRLPGYEWSYLRFTDDGAPAAGPYESWPKEARALRVLDPCMGSGHFLVFALPILVGMRMVEEGLGKDAAIDGVLAQNLYGLELDSRCTQIAAFNLALAAWKMGGYRPLPALNLACSGLGVNAREAEWVKLADGSARSEGAMRELFRLFERAPLLGSLIDPKRVVKGDLLTAEFEEVKGFLEKALAAEDKDETRSELAIAARGLFKALEILAGDFTLVATNVPYLGRGKQHRDLQVFCEEQHGDAKADLATCFVERALKWNATLAAVLPQNWLFMSTYEDFRLARLRTTTFTSLAALGPHAFDAISGEIVQVCLAVCVAGGPESGHRFAGIDASAPRAAAAKAELLRKAELLQLDQHAQAANPEARIILAEVGAGAPLGLVGSSFIGFQTSDNPRFAFAFWEVGKGGSVWDFLQLPSRSGGMYTGRTGVLRWENGGGALAEIGLVKGTAAWGKRGVAVRLMSDLPVAVYTGEKFEQSSAVIIPSDDRLLPALYSFCSSPQFLVEVRKIDRALKITNKTFEKIPFDAEHWRRAAAEEYPDGLPKPHSSDPTQWLFNGHPRDSDSPLHVAAARLVGFRWPRQSGAAFMDCPAVGADGLEDHEDADGIVCLAPLRGEATAADRLKALLAKAYGPEWSAAKLTELLRQLNADTLEVWLRDSFFTQHCELFQQRPFVWQVWDGTKDGFSALVSYHKLAGENGLGRRTLEALVYTYLGEWIARKKAEVASGHDGADMKLAAAEHLKSQLEKVLNGEPPYDIFVRWKSLSSQAVGWEPDIDDGVRVNIRPFVAAAPISGKGCVLRAMPGIKWGRDKGAEPERPRAHFPWLWSWDEGSGDFLGGAKFDGVRWNDLHYTRAAKLAARQDAKRGGKP